LASLQFGSFRIAWQLAIAGSHICLNPHEVQAGSAGFVAHADVPRAAVVPWAVVPRRMVEPGKSRLAKTHPCPPTDIGSTLESSSSVSITTASEESGRKKAFR
jgi:hypothetical protein